MMTQLPFCTCDLCLIHAGFNAFVMFCIRMTYCLHRIFFLSKILKKNVNQSEACVMATLSLGSQSPSRSFEAKDPGDDVSQPRLRAFSSFKMAGHTAVNSK